MLFRRPYFLNQLPPETSTSLARLTGIDSLGRSLLVGVLPLIALKAFDNKETIATVYFASAIITLIFTLNIATLEQLLQRRWLLTLGGLMLIVSVLFFSAGNAPLFSLGVGLRSAGSTIFAVCMSLYIMDYIGKAELTRSESRRMIYNGAAWLLGPAVGIWIYENSPEFVVFLVSAVATVLMLLYFWRLRWGNNPVIQPARSRAKNPLGAIVRYFSQSRLRIAYLITLSRACFWSALFVYGPIYVVEAGLPSWVGGVMLSGASGLLFFSPVVQRLAERFGTRQVIIVCFLLIGLGLFGLGFVGLSQPIGLLFWIVGAVGAGGIDVLGNIPFMRMVRPRERSEMTMVFTTWREGSSLLTQALVFLTLLVAPFWVFYFVLGVLQLLTAVSTTRLPRRL
ncbi:MAG: MFS transporter [Chloroflexota bacterium]